MSYRIGDNLRKRESGLYKELATFDLCYKYPDSSLDVPLIVIWNGVVYDFNFVAISSLSIQ